MIRIILLLCLLSPLGAQEVSPSLERKDEPAPSADPAEKYKLPANSTYLRSVRDKTVFSWKVQQPELDQHTDLHMEELAYEMVLLHAAQFSHEELEAQARRDVPFGSLVGNEGVSYKFELIRIEGRLRRLVRVDVEKSLKEKGIEAVYEAWIFPTHESTPLCIFVTQLPPGLTPMKDLLHDNLDKPVAVTGYYFKLAKYEQTAPDRSQPGKHKVWFAPAFIGKSITVLPDGALEDAAMNWRMTFLPIIIGGVTAMALTLVYLSWRYRRGDRAVLEKALERRQKNPFDS